MKPTPFLTLCCHKSWRYLLNLVPPCHNWLAAVSLWQLVATLRRRQSPPTPTTTFSWPLSCAIATVLLWQWGKAIPHTMCIQELRASGTLFTSILANAISLIRPLNTSFLAVKVLSDSTLPSGWWNICVKSKNLSGCLPFKLQFKRLRTTASSSNAFASL